jgi:RHS repeat-associated protein
MANLNPFRFSTKYQDDETDLVYYGYRYYNASTGRFLNQDPIGEQGGLNLYGFCGNNPVKNNDFLGLEKMDMDYITSDFGIKDWLWAGGPTRVENLSEILADIKAKIGNIFDADGKCGNCIRKLTITSHSGLEGYVGFSPIEGASYGQSDYYSNGNFSNPTAAKVFNELKKYFCKDGKVYLMECDAGKGDPGTETLTNMSNNLGVPVTAPQVATRVGRTPKCTKTAYPDGTVSTSGDCNSTVCIKKPTKRQP